MSGVEWFAVGGISDYGYRRVTTTWRAYAAMAGAAIVASYSPRPGSRPS